MPRRLRILEDEEIEALYGIPRFTPEERLQYFTLSPREKAALEQVPTIKTRLFFLLQLGYFKARHQFFTFRLSPLDEGGQPASPPDVDAAYLRERYFPDFDFDELAINKRTRLKNQHLILELCGYRYCDAALRGELRLKARQAARVCSKPVYIFRELILLLAEQRAVAPGYSFLQDAVGHALTYEQDRLTGLVRNRLQADDLEALELLLDDPAGLHEITQLKRQPKDFTLGQINHEIERGRQIEPLYRLASEVLPDIEKSNESITYSASLVGYYSVYKLKRLDRAVVYLYLLCFLFHRYQRLHDNLINCLIHDVKRYSDQAKAAAKERVYLGRIEGKQNLQRAASVLRLFTDDTIAADTPFSEVQARAFDILDRRRLDAVADHIETKARFDETAMVWEHIDTLAHQFKRHLRPVLLALDFVAASARDPLIEATHFLKRLFSQSKPLGKYPQAAFPIVFVPETTRRYLYARQGERQRLLPDRYEFLVYRQLRNGLEAGDIFCRFRRAFPQLRVRG